MIGKFYIYKFLFFILPLIVSCSSPSLDDLDGTENPDNPGSSGEAPPYDFDQLKEGDILPIYYTEDGGKSFAVRYEAVRIGEYLWMNSNFTAPVGEGNYMTQNQINEGLNVYRIDTLEYKLTPEDVNKYIGQYYSRAELEGMEYNGNMFEGDDKIERGKWGLPSVEAFRQLFAMCGDGNELDVRNTLVYKVNQIPIIKKAENIFWITDGNTNRYGFNLIYAGERAHNYGFEWSVCHDWPDDCQEFTSDKGDFIIFYTTASYPASGAMTVMIHDYLETSRGKEWAWKTVRWARRLTDKELGYRLYVNRDRTDIVKIGPDDTPPDNYEVLPDGYLRGFYVQYILNNPNPVKTVRELRQMELNIAEVRHGAVKPT